MNFSGVYTFNSRYSSGQLFLCRNSNTSVYGAYTMQNVVVGVLEGVVSRDNVLEGVFVDAGGVNGKFSLLEKTNKNTSVIELTGTYWFLNSKQFAHISGYSIQERKLSSVASPAQCLTSSADIMDQKSNMSGTWVNTNKNKVTWCANTEQMSGVGDQSDGSVGASRAQIFMNGRVWAGVWINNDPDASFYSGTMGAFLRVRMDSNVTIESQWKILDGNYFNLNTSTWQQRSVIDLTKESDQIGTCVSQQNQLPWMGTFNLGNNKLLYVCYTQGNALKGAIATLDSKTKQLQLRGSVFGTLDSKGRTWTGWWYDVTEKKPYYGMFDIKISDNITRFDGSRTFGEVDNSTYFGGERMTFQSLPDFFANDEQCKLTLDDSHFFEGVWTLNQPKSLADNDVNEWGICPEYNKTAVEIIPYVSQQQLLNGVMDKHQSISVGVHDNVKVISIIRRVGNLMESHFWNEPNSFNGAYLNAKTYSGRPANDICYAVSKKDDMLSLVIAVGVPCAITILSLTAVLAVLLTSRFLYRRKYYNSIQGRYLSL